MTAIKPARAIAIVLSLAAVAVTLLATSLPAMARGKARDELSRVRAATARFHDLAVAQDDGYALLKDAAGIACIDNPGVGAMGVHYANGEVIATGEIDAVRPQALVYAPAADGDLRLAAVEYVVFQAAWDAAHDAPPALFGEEFMLTPDGNRFGLPAFYALHAWIWERNPSGMFSMWNPRVRCGATAPTQAADVAPPPMPADIQVPAGNTLFLVGHAVGTQNYVCLPSGAGVKFVLFTPQATLFDGGEQVTTHFFSPNPSEGGTIRATWQHSRDTSTVWGQVKPGHSSSDPAFVEPGAIPWLLVTVVGSQDGPTGGDKLTLTTYIQRLNTSGGSAPSTGCSLSTDVGNQAFVPYTTDYYFYKPAA